MILMCRRFLFALFIHCTIFLGSAWAATEASSTRGRFDCGGILEEDVWSLWEGGKHSEARGSLDHRLGMRSDVYVLYDLQTRYHNLYLMSVRCNRVSRQHQFASLIERAYGYLEINQSVLGKGAGWICRGGALCSQRSDLANRELVLVSSQFLGFATDIAAGYSANEIASDIRVRSFVERTVEVTLEHLLRWSGPREEADLLRRIEMDAAQVSTKGSERLLTDKHVWQLVAYLNLAGALKKMPWSRSYLGLSISERDQLKKYLESLLILFSKRLTIEVVGDGLYRVRINIDHGFWTNRNENRYAGYEGTMSPHPCVDDNRHESNQAKGGKRPLPILRRDVGWDFSHSRRFVHLSQSMDKYGDLISDIWGVSSQALLAKQLSNGLVTQLIDKIWNGDKGYPLFSNYWNGVNGWYRVAYTNRPGNCQEGIPPYGFSEVFATGGYIIWSTHSELIRMLGIQIMRLTESTDYSDRDFVFHYYPSLHSMSDPRIRSDRQLMFWPNLIGH